MTKFVNKSFTVPIGGETYGKEWDRIFGTPHYEVPREALELRYAELRKLGDEAWAKDEKDLAEQYHREASAIAVTLGINAVRCAKCGAYFEARGLTEHQEACSA